MLRSNPSYDDIFLDSECESSIRGVCFDQTFKNELTVNEIEYALKEIFQKLGKKIYVLLFDSCRMMGIEILIVCHRYVHYLVGSEELVRGEGYEYDLLLKPLAEKNIYPDEYAKYVVNAYAEVCSLSSDSFTESAIDLTHFSKLVDEFRKLMTMLFQPVDCDKHSFIKDLINIASSDYMIMHFSDPSYLDFRNFLEKIIVVLSQKKGEYSENVIILDYINTIIKKVEDNIIPILYSIIIANEAGSKCSQASRLYIYFPYFGKEVDSGYKNNFSEITLWKKFINHIKD